jgi:Fe-coproporphyrin III synthase
MIDTLRPLLNLTGDRLRALPMLILYITDGCNSRCITCDIWKLPRRNMSLELVERLTGEFAALGVKRVLLSGGEAMQHPHWPEIAQMIRAVGAKVMLLTNGLALKKQADQVIANVDELTVSLDGATPETYHAIRGVNALPVILEGISAVSAAGIPVTTRTTLQRNNFREMAAIVDVAKSAGVHRVSFLAVDVSSVEAFGPRYTAESGLPIIHTPKSPTLTTDELPEFAAVLDQLEYSYADDFASGLIAESPTKLRKLHHYFMAVNGLTNFDPPRCNAPHTSLVVEVDGSVLPCFFLPTATKLDDKPLSSVINDARLTELRHAYRTGQRSECERCVCPLYRGPRSLLNG